MWSIHHHIKGLIHRCLLLILIVFFRFLVLVVFELRSFGPNEPVVFITNFWCNARLKLITDLPRLLNFIFIWRMKFSRNRGTIMKNLRYERAQLLSIFTRWSHLFPFLWVISLKMIVVIIYDVRIPQRIFCRWLCHSLYTYYVRHRWLYNIRHRLLIFRFDLVK